MWDKIVDIEKCYLQATPSNEIRNSIKDFAQKNKLDFFNPRNHSGLLRSLMIRNTIKRELMVLIQFYNDNKEKDKQYVTCRLAKKRIVLTQKICIYIGPNKTNDTIFIDRFEYCPRQIQCIYQPNKSIPMIEEMMQSLEDTLRKNSGKKK